MLSRSGRPVSAAWLDIFEISSRLHKERWLFRVGQSSSTRLFEEQIEILVYVPSSGMKAVYIELCARHSSK